MQWLAQELRGERVDSGLHLPAAHPIARPAQHWPDRVLGNSEMNADLAVSATFEMVLTHNLGVGIGQVLEQPLHFFTVFNPLGVWGSHVGAVDAGTVVLRAAIGQATLAHFAHHNAAGNDSEVCRQRTLAAKPAQDGEIIRKQSEKDFGAQVVDVLRTHPYTARVRGMVNYVDEKTDKTVNEVFPGARLFGKAALEKITIDLGQSHWKSRSAAKGGSTHIRP